LFFAGEEACPYRYEIINKNILSFIHCLFSRKGRKELRKDRRDFFVLFSDLVYLWQKVLQRAQSKAQRVSHPLSINCQSIVLIYECGNSHYYYTIGKI